MGKKFIQASLYNQKETVFEHGFEKTLYSVMTNSSEEDELIKDTKAFALIMSRKHCGDMNWKKYVMECAISLVQEMADSMSPNMKKPYNNPDLSEHDIPMDMLNQIRKTAAALSYMVNSTSWRDGVYQPFDKREIKSRLEQAVLLGRSDKR